MMRAFGIDFSPRTTTRYIYQDHHDVCLVGMTDGTYILPGGDDLLEEAEKAPVTVAWHYLRSERHWKDQIETLMRATENHEVDGYAVDYERINNVKSYDFAYMAKLVIDKITMDTGKRCMLYSSPSIIQEWMYPYEQYFIRRDNYYLWCSQWPYYGYNSAMDNVTDPNSGWEPRLPAGVTSWKWWQYSADGNGKAAENGIQGNPDVDLNVYNGTVADMKVWLTMSEPDPPDPPVDPCAELKQRAEKVVLASAEMAELL